MNNKEITILKYHLKLAGGLEKQTEGIIQRCLDKNYKVSLITTKTKNSLPLNHSSFLTFHFVKNFTFLNFFKILFFDLKASSIIKKKKPKISLAMDRTTNQTHIRTGNGIHKAYLEKRKKYFGFWDHLLGIVRPFNHLILYLEKKAFKNPSLKTIITNSQMVKDEILKFYKIPASKITVIHNGTSLKYSQKFFQDSLVKKNEIAKKLNINPHKYNFLFIGNGYKRKGLKILLTATSLLKKKYDNFNLLIVGKEKKINKYKQYAKKIGLTNHALFFGEQQNTMSFYQIADSFVQPSYYDPFANTTIEALSMGLFTISSQENGGKEIINKKNGLIIKDLLNAAEIAHCLEKALKNPKTEKTATVIRNSVNHLDISYQQDKIIETILNDD